MMKYRYTKKKGHQKMTILEYAQDAKRTFTEDKSKDNMLTHALLGLCGEAGEAADALKKSKYQGHQLDAIAMAYELGDVLFYLAMGAEALGITLDDVAGMNIEKRKERYPEKFSTERSVNRDKSTGAEGRLEHRRRTQEIKQPTELLCPACGDTHIRRIESDEKDTEYICRECKHVFGWRAQQNDD